MRRRHLTVQEGVAALRRGRQIEQWLGADQLEDGPTAIGWLTASRRGTSFALVRHRVRDVWTPDFFDVTVFPAVDEQEEFGEGVVLADASDPEQLLEQAVAHGADPERWVNQGVVQDEYRDSRRGTSDGL